MVQYLQLISNTSSPYSLDVWTPSDNFIKPQIADQVALGYFKILKMTCTVEVKLITGRVQNRLDLY
jgi:hypothetical protein